MKPKTGWGGPRPGAGRKRKPEEDKLKYVTLSVSMLPDEAVKIKQLAQEAGKSVSKFILSCIEKISPLH